MACDTCQFIRSWRGCIGVKYQERDDDADAVLTRPRPVNQACTARQRV